MSLPVYAWPPVVVVGHEWSVVDPIEASRSLLSGARYASAVQRRRRVATMIAVGIDGTGDGVGYIEALKRYLRGGVSLVRLYSIRNALIGAPVPDDLRQAQRMTWTTEEEGMGWTSGPDDLTWFTGALMEVAVVDDDGFPGLQVTGLPASSKIANAGEFITAFATIASTTGESAMIARPAYSDASGVATIRLVEALSFTPARIDIGVSETGVFEALQIPGALQMAGSQFSYEWRFREIFADEVGGFTEIDPW